MRYRPVTEQKLGLWRLGQALLCFVQRRHQGLLGGVQLFAEAGHAVSPDFLHRVLPSFHGADLPQFALNVRFDLTEGLEGGDCFWSKSIRRALAWRIND